MKWAIFIAIAMANASEKFDANSFCKGWCIGVGDKDGFAVGDDCTCIEKTVSIKDVVGPIEIVGKPRVSKDVPQYNYQMPSHSLAY